MKRTLGSITDFLELQPSRRLALRALLAVAPVLVACTPPARAQSCLDWRLRATSGPSPRGEFGLAHDSRRGVTVLVGGAQNLSFNDVFGETWEWNGQSWTLVTTSGLTARCDNAMGYDSTREVVLSFGGYDGTFLRDTWAWDGVGWQLRANNLGPSARADSSMVFDPTDAAMILFGGLAGGQVRQDTWRWGGTSWTSLTPATLPAQRWIHRMAYDAARDEIVVFGGAGTSSVLGDMWSWTGSDWVQRTPATLPPPRYGNAIAYDSQRQVVLLFGGQTGFDFGVGVLGDTWEWNGTAWSQLAVSGPTARTFVKMAYDERRRKIVLFGGYDGTQFVNDTWELGSDLDIASQPTGTAVAPGGHAELHVVASGTGPFTYQWTKNGAPVLDGGHIFGATTATLVLDPAEPADDGRYAVVISNACGPVTSHDAMVAVPGSGEASHGNVPAEAMRASYDRATGTIGVSYTPGCGASGHTIHYGSINGISTYRYSGAACSLGASGAASFNPGPGSVFFLIVGDDGTLEGSYGRSSAGVERPEHRSTAGCELPQSVSAACD